MVRLAFFWRAIFSALVATSVVSGPPKAMYSMGDSSSRNTVEPCDVLAMDAWTASR